MDERKHTHKIEMYPNMAPSCYMNKLTLQKHPCLLACPLGTNVLIILEFCQRVKTPLAQSFFFSVCFSFLFFSFSSIILVKHLYHCPCAFSACLISTHRAERNLYTYLHTSAPQNILFSPLVFLSFSFCLSPQG